MYLTRTGTSAIEPCLLSLYNPLFIGVLPSHQVIPTDGDPAQFLPQLLDQMIALGEIAKQVSQAFGGNGHRPEAVQDLLAIMAGGKREGI